VGRVTTSRVIRAIDAYFAMYKKEESNCFSFWCDNKRDERRATNFKKLLIYYKHDEAASYLLIYCLLASDNESALNHTVINRLGFGRNGEKALNYYESKLRDSYTLGNKETLNRLNHVIGNIVKLTSNNPSPSNLIAILRAINEHSDLLRFAKFV
jgi:hypothetical protein